jgi:hypothetical protein
MKRTLFAVAITVSAFGAFAQSSDVTPTELCQKITRTNSSNGNVCAQLISRNTFEPQALRLASRTADSQGTSAAIEILRTTANRRYDLASFDVCEKILPVNSGNVIPCLNTIADATFAPEILRMSIKMLQSQGSTQALNMLKTGANIYLYAPAAEICEAMISINTTNAVVCIQTIANKVTLNGSEQICRTALSNGSAYALECLRGIVTDYVPVPEPTRIMVELYQLQDLKRTLSKARAQLNRGMIDNAQKSLDEASTAVDLLMSTVPLR